MSECSSFQFVQVQLQLNSELGLTQAPFNWILTLFGIHMHMIFHINFRMIFSELLNDFQCSFFTVCLLCLVILTSRFVIFGASTLISTENEIHFLPNKTLVHTERNLNSCMHIGIGMWYKKNMTESFHMYSSVVHLS